MSLERTGSQQHFHNLSTPACSLPCSGLLSSDVCVSLFEGLTRPVRYVVRCLTAGATTPSHVAAVVSGWSDSRVSTFLHLARQRACWWVCAVARFCLDRMGACDWVSWSSCLRHVSGWVGGVIFARRRPQKNLATRSLGCGRVAWTLANTRQFFTAGARMPAPWQVPEERKRWRMRFLVKLLCLIFKEIQVRAALLDIQGDLGARPLHVRRFFLAKHHRSLSQFAGLTRWLGRSLGRWASWRSK